MRWWLWLLLIPTATAAPLIVGVAPDLSGPGPGDEGFAIAGPGDLTGWSITDGETTWAFPPGTMAGTEPSWFAGDPAIWAAHGGEPAIGFGDALRLGNDGDSLHLIDPQGLEADAFYWGDKSPADWPDWGVTSSDLVYQRARTDGWVDTDGPEDWRSPRPHRIGESQIPPQSFMADRVTAYVSPDSSFDVITTLLDGAQDRVVLHVYELRSHLLVDALVSAAKRGVDVTVLVDSGPVGMEDADRHETASGLQRIEDAGGTSWLAGKARYRFHHLKVLVVDDATAIQSENWVASGVPADPTWGNRGWGIVVHGAAFTQHVADVLAADRAAWDTSRFDVLSFDPTFREPPRFAIPRGDHRPIHAARSIEGPIPVRMVWSPDHTAEPATSPVVSALAAANERLWAQQLDLSTRAWTLLDWSAADPVWSSLADSGAEDVRVMAAPPFHADDTGNPMAMDALPATVETCTFAAPGMRLHNKGLIADDVVYIGSMNGNHHSRAMNREAGVLVDHPGVADFYAEVFLDDWSSCGPRSFDVPAPVPIPLMLVMLAMAWRRCIPSSP